MSHIYFQCASPIKQVCSHLHIPFAFCYSYFLCIIPIKIEPVLRMFLANGEIYYIIIINIFQRIPSESLAHFAGWRRYLLPQIAGLPSRSDETHRPKSFIELDPNPFVGDSKNFLGCGRENDPMSGFFNFHQNRLGEFLSSLRLCYLGTLVPWHYNQVVVYDGSLTSNLPCRK